MIDLHFRYGNSADWQSTRWSVKDLGGLNGTYVNRVIILFFESNAVNQPS